MKNIKLRIAGANYYKDGIRTIAMANPNFKKGNITKKEYEFYPIKEMASLEFEPDNKEDKNAIKIIIKGVKVGYIPADHTGEIKKLIKWGMVINCKAKIIGGAYIEPVPNTENQIIRTEGDIHGDIDIEIKNINTKLLIITIFGGWFGLHKFIEGKWKMGILYFLTVGIFGFGWIYDIIKILIGKNNA